MTRAQREPELTEEVIETLRPFLEEMEANPNPDMDELQRWQTFRPRLPPGTFVTPYPPPLIVAIYTQSGPLVKLLLKHGATASFFGADGLIDALFGNQYAEGNIYSSGWTVDEEDTLTMLGMIREDIEKTSNEWRRDHYDDRIHKYLDRAADPNHPPAQSDRILAAVEALLSPRPTPPH